MFLEREKLANGVFVVDGGHFPFFKVLLLREEMLSKN